MSKFTMYVHIGAGKTGSTSIQRFIVDNYGILTKMGYHIPTADYAIGFDAIHTQVQYFASLKSINDTQISRFYEDTLTHHRYMKQNGLTKLIISSENLLYDLGIFSRLFDAVSDLFDIRILLYVRNQLEWIPSAYKQWSFKLDDFDTHLDRCTSDPAFCNWDAIIRPWEQRLGQERIYMQALDRKRLRGASLIKDFAIQIGIPVDSSANFVEDRHDYVGINDLSILSILHLRSLMTSRHDHRLQDLLREHALELSTQKPAYTALMTAEQQQQVKDAFRAPNRELFRRYYSESSYDLIPEDYQIAYQPATEDEISTHNNKLLWQVILSQNEIIHQLNQKVDHLGQQLAMMAGRNNPQKPAPAVKAPAPKAILPAPGAPDYRAQLVRYLKSIQK